MSKITNKTSDRVEYLDFEIFEIITIDNVNKLDNSILYSCTLLLQTSKKAVAKID